MGTIRPTATKRACRFATAPVHTRTVTLSLCQASLHAVDRETGIRATNGSEQPAVYRVGKSSLHAVDGLSASQPTRVRSVIPLRKKTRRWRVFFRTERAGFEPAERCDPFTDLANRRIQPLCHLSKWLSEN